MSAGVYIIDDSAVMRQVMAQVIDADPDLHCVGSAPDPIAAQRRLAKITPDVLLLDVDMPRMDGVTFLKHIMSHQPIPVIIYTGVTSRHATLGLEALASGAIDVIEKPKSQLTQFLKSEGVKGVLDALKIAASTKVKPLKYLNEQNLRPKGDIDQILKPSLPHVPVDGKRLIAIGASTGGTEAIAHLLKGLPSKMPPIVIVQHMPPSFTQAFATRLNATTGHRVIHATNGLKLKAGHVYIAPGGRHTMVVDNDGYQVDLSDGPLVQRHKPSVDVLFRSVAQSAGARGIGVILTGMGSDGAQGLLEMRQAGAMTYAESEMSCVVFGMPKEAIALGAVQKIYSLQSLPYQLQKSLVDE
ncbi:chemotaxis response regulator protein-glutamate methylesterase [Vibrio sp. SCSIO 43136]|uniref:protein-glutamate methylesterase/protein-glutamine glutaminase n=1 Tax=Vibrio sp. SCSIO 43136 TaxID=2819101 RepID=UPI002074B338|nr:chemotaxis response regulator protein-glutamate methylesterase [Vibrio sp. SCSIO 43136]USD64250.1 chemotaxis response regulator protein-glutamate methylesterase [Vibrio sp. SCSIO 43136]